MLSLASPVTVSAPEPVRTFSKLRMMSLPTPVFWAVSTDRLTVTPVEPLNATVSTPAPPSRTSSPRPPSITLALASPVRMSLPAPPVRFSMLRNEAINEPPTVAVPSAAPANVAVTPAVYPAKEAVSEPAPPSSRSTVPAAFAPGLRVSSPAPP